MLVERGGQYKSFGNIKSWRDKAHKGIGKRKQTIDNMVKTIASRAETTSGITAKDIKEVSDYIDSQFGVKDADKVLEALDQAIGDTPTREQCEAMKHFDRSLGIAQTDCQAAVLKKYKGILKAISKGISKTKSLIQSNTQGLQENLRRSPEGYKSGKLLAKNVNDALPGPGLAREAALDTLKNSPDSASKRAYLLLACKYRPDEAEKEMKGYLKSTNKALIGGVGVDDTKTKGAEAVFLNLQTDLVDLFPKDHVSSKLRQSMRMIMLHDSIVEGEKTSLDDPKGKFIEFVASKEGGIGATARDLGRIYDTKAKDNKIDKLIDSLFGQLGDVDVKAENGEVVKKTHVDLAKELLQIEGKSSGISEASQQIRDQLLKTKEGKIFAQLNQTICKKGFVEMLCMKVGMDLKMPPPSPTPDSTIITYNEGKITSTKEISVGSISNNDGESTNQPFFTLSITDTFSFDADGMVTSMTTRSTLDNIAEGLEGNQKLFTEKMQLLYGEVPIQDSMGSGNDQGPAGGATTVSI